VVNQLTLQGPLCYYCVVRLPGAILKDLTFTLPVISFVVTAPNIELDCPNVLFLLSAIATTEAKLRMLLRSSPNSLLLATTKTGENLLHVVAMFNNLEMAKLLLTPSEPHCMVSVLDSPNQNGCTPLYFATQSNNFEMVKLFLTCGATSI